MFTLNDFEYLCENVFILKKWNWDYLEAEAFQLQCVEFVRENPQVCLLIFCSHPHSFTLGRGLQKGKDDQMPLVDFDPELSLPFPLYKIKRGGGLTFHYPGQMVFYPILNLTYHGLGVFDLMLEVLNIAKKAIEEQFHFDGLVCRRDLLGLWFENELNKTKLASIGLAASRFITYHGFALNFFSDDQMFSALKSVHPCGLPGNLYQSLEALNGEALRLEEREKFQISFLQSFLDKIILKNHLIIERQRSSSEIFDSISLRVN